MIRQAFKVKVRDTMIVFEHAMRFVINRYTV